VSRHVLRSLPQSFEAVWDGLKTYEVCKDLGFEIGDTIELREHQPPVDPLELKVEGYSGRLMLAEVVYKTPGGNWGLPIGLCVLGIFVFSRSEDEDPPSDLDVASSDRDQEVSDVEIYPCTRCGGRVRFSARGEAVEDSLRYAMHTKPACLEFEARVRELLSEFVASASGSS
jgi:hypothetical protein